jgi:hypothetical protein
MLWSDRTLGATNADGEPAKRERRGGRGGFVSSSRCSEKAWTSSKSFSPTKHPLGRTQGYPGAQGRCCGFRIEQPSYGARMPLRQRKRRPTGTGSRGPPSTPSSTPSRNRRRGRKAATSHIKRGQRLDFNEPSNRRVGLQRRTGMAQTLGDLASTLHSGVPPGSR